VVFWFPVTYKNPKYQNVNKCLNEKNGGVNFEHVKWIITLYIGVQNTLVRASREHEKLKTNAWKSHETQF